MNRTTSHQQSPHRGQLTVTTMIPEPTPFRPHRSGFFAGPAIVTGLLLGLSSLTQAAELTQPQKDLAINGPYYKKLVQMKDVVADILPPPAYIIEAYLNVLCLIDTTEVAMADGKIDDAEMKAIDELIDYGRKLKVGSPGVFPGYYERLDVWKVELSDTVPDEKLLKKLLLVKSAEPATKFFDLRDSNFNPLIKAGDVKGAKKYAQTILKPLYQDHRFAIDAVVSRSRRVNEKIEKEVAEMVANAEKGHGNVKASDIQIKGDLYVKIIKMKDLVSDILPPPCYIIESYLTVLQQIDEAEIALADGTIDAKEKTILDGLLEYGRQLESGDSSKGEMAGYKERQIAWNTELATASPEDQLIKNLMTKQSYEPAMKFYDVRDKKFLAAINAGSVADAEKISRQDLLPLYLEHRKHIDALVVAANKMYDQTQAKVDGLLAQMPK